MPEKTLFFTHHGQGHHNVDDKTHIRDALLTDKGIEQARLHNESIRDNVSKQAELIVCSPLRRTVQTMLYGYADAVARLGKDKILIMPEVQEASDDPCDTGLDRADPLKDPLYQGRTWLVAVDPHARKMARKYPQVSSQSLQHRAHTHTHKSTYRAWTMTGMRRRANLRPLLKPYKRELSGWASSYATGQRIASCS